MIKKTKKIGILGGTFDPCHIGHLKISKEAKKKFNLEKVIWTITKKNPFKNESNLSLENRIKISKKFTKKYKFIQIHHYEKRIRSNKTIDLINYLKKKFINKELYLLIGADNLVKFHKWKNWKKIPKLAKIVVFPRKNYSFSSIATKKLHKSDFIYIKSKKIDISSSIIRKFWLH